MHTWTSSFWLTSRELRSVFLLCEGFSLGGESAAERGPGKPRAQRKAGRGQRKGVAAGAGGHRGTRAAAPHGRNPRVRAHLEALGLEGRCGVGWVLGPLRAHGWSRRLTGAGRSCRVTWGHCPHRCPGHRRGRWGGRGGGGCGCAGSRGSSWRRVRACRTGGRNGAPAPPRGHPGSGTRDGTPCGCHVPPDLSLGLGGTPWLLQSCWQAARDPALPEVPRYSSGGGRGGVSLGLPRPPGMPRRPCPQHRCPAAGSRGVSPSRQCPVTYRQRVPAACKRRAGLDGAAGERHQARATSHQDRLGGDTGPSLRPGLNQGAAICSPKISDTPNFCVFLGFNQSTLGCWGHGSSPAPGRA